MFYHAEINQDNICIAVGSTTNEVIGNNIISLDSYDTSLLGQRYNDGVWEPVEAPEMSSEPLTVTEQAILDTAVNIEYLVAMKELNL